MPSIESILSKYDPSSSPEEPQSAEPSPKAAPSSIDSILSKYESSAPTAQEKPQLYTPNPFVSTAKSTAASMANAFAGQPLEDIGETIGSETLQKAGKGVREFAEGVQKENPSQIGSLSDIVDKPLTAVETALGNVAPQIPVSLAGGYAGAKLGGSLPLPLPAKAVAAGVGGILGAFAPNYLQEAAEMRGKQQESGVEDKTKAYLTAIPAAGLETASDVLLAGKFLPKAVKDTAIGKTLTGLGDDTLSATGSRAAHVGKQALKGAGTEAGTEYAQTILEQLGGNQDTSTEEAQAEREVSAALGAIGGGAIGGGISAFDKRAGEDQPPVTDEQTATQEQAATQEPDFAEVPDVNPQEPIIAGAPSDLDLRTDEEKAAERQDRFNDLSARFYGTSDTDTVFEGKQVTIPGRPKEFLAPEEKAELVELEKEFGTPIDLSTPAAPAVDTKKTEDFLNRFENAWASTGKEPTRVTKALADEATRLGVPVTPNDSPMAVVAAMRAEIQARKTPEEVAQDVGDTIVAETLAAYPDGKPGIAGKTVIAGASTKVLEPQKIAAEQKVAEQQPFVEEPIDEQALQDEAAAYQAELDAIPGVSERPPLTPLTAEDLQKQRMLREAALAEQLHPVDEQSEADEAADAEYYARLEANKAAAASTETPVTQQPEIKNGESEDQTSQTTTQKVTPEYALREIGRLSDEAMGGNHPAMPQQSLANGDFAGSGKLNMDDDGNVVLTRVASSEDHLSKDWQDISGEELINTSLSHGGGRGIPTSGIASWGKSYGATHGGDRVIGTFKIPLQDLLSAIRNGNAILGNIGEGEIVLNPAFAESYLASITDTEGNPVIRKQDGVSLPADITGRAETATQKVDPALEEYRSPVDGWETYSHSLKGANTPVEPVTGVTYKVARVIADKANKRKDGYEYRIVAHPQFDTYKVERKAVTPQSGVAGQIPWKQQKEATFGADRVELDNAPVETKNAKQGESFDERVERVKKEQLAMLDRLRKEAEEPVKPLSDQIAEAAYARNPKGEQSTPGTVSHHDIAGVPVNIETPAETTRQSKDGAYPPRKMTSHYGNISKVKGKDGDQLDVFINPKASDEQLTNPKSVFVIDQIDPATGKYDETKIMLGYDSEAQAREKYLENYDSGWQGLGAISEMPFGSFKERIESGANWDEPVAYKEPAVEEKPKAKKDKVAVMKEPPIKEKRYDIGKALTKEQRKEVISSLKDAYRVKGADKETRLDRNGNEYIAYPYQPELFEKSDITGQAIRYYVTLPDGRMAHPSELFPDMPQSKIENAILEQQSAEQKRKDWIQSLLSSNVKQQFDSVPEAEDYWDAQAAKGGFAPSIDRTVFSNGEKFISVSDKTLAPNPELVDELQKAGWGKHNFATASTPTREPAVEEKPEPPIPFSRVETSEPLPELFESLGRVNKLSQLSDDQLNRIDEHPDAERIRYVQDNFLTLLSELDTNNKVQIKC